MNREEIKDGIKDIANAILYEGYILYPYRPSSVKNRQRWTFGGVFPQNFSMQSGSDPWSMQAECLVEGDSGAEVAIQLRFLQVIAREIREFDSAAPADASPEGRAVPLLEVEGRQYAPWEEALEREIAIPSTTLAALLAEPLRTSFLFSGGETREVLCRNDGQAAGAILRRRQPLNGKTLLSCEKLSATLFRLRLRIENTTPLKQAECESRALAQGHAFASTHAILRVEGGSFVSLTDFPPSQAGDVAACVNQGLWPVLVGRPGAGDAMLASPIILYDYPQIAPESPGDLFDGCEIDEILTLRILTMTDAEKREAAAADPRTRALLERTEALTADDMAKMHGALRSPRAFPKPELATLSDPHGTLAVGARVRLNPKKKGGDVFDVVLAGKIAIVESIERDFEDRVHVAVTIEDDPGRDMGMDRFPGHRFFFSRDEIEPLAGEAGG